MPEIIFSKKEFEIWYFESMFWSKFGFWGLLQGVLAGVFFGIFRWRLTMVADIFTQSPTIKMLPTILLVNKKGWQMPNTEQLFFQADKKSHRSCSIKKAVLKHFAIFTGKLKCRSLFFDFIEKKLLHRYFSVAKFLRTLILRNICAWLLLNWLEKVIVWNFFSQQSLSKPS